jgi:hypothetical protein
MGVRAAFAGVAWLGDDKEKAFQEGAAHGTLPSAPALRTSASIENWAHIPLRRSEYALPQTCVLR